MNFPVVFFAFMGWALALTHGQYHTLIIPYTVLFFVNVFVLWKKDKTIPRPNDKGLSLALALCTSFFLFLLCRNPQLIHPTVGSWFILIKALLRISLVLMLVVDLLLLARDRRKPAAPLIVMIWILMLTAHCLVPLASPAPSIDVFVNSTAAADFLLSGNNPYAQSYVDIYHGFYDYKPAFMYFPGLLLWIAPARAIFGDIRFAYVAAQILIALALYRFARQRAHSKESALLFGLVWLSFPVTLFVLEQSWVDTLLIALSCGIFWGLSARRVVTAGFFMGLAFSIKQYGFLISALSALYILRYFPRKEALRAILVGFSVTLGVLGAFAFWNWDAFFESVVMNQWTAAARPDAFNLNAYLMNRFGLTIPLAVTALLAGLGWIISSLRILRFPTLPSIATGLLLSYGLSFLFGKWAFCNYHYLLASFQLLCILALGSDCQKLRQNKEH